MQAGLFLALLWTACPVRSQETGEPATFGGRSAAGPLCVDCRPDRLGLLAVTGPSDTPTEPYDSVLFQGLSPCGGVVLEASRLGPSGAWSGWIAARTRWFGTGRFWGRVEFAGAAAAPLRFRARRPGGGECKSVEIYSMELFVRGGGEEPSSPRRPPPIPADVAPKPDVLAREAWGAAAPRDEPVLQAPERITQHHTAGRLTTTLEETLQEARFIQDFHKNGRGWSDIGYHFLIDASGRMVQGRPETVVGAHVRGNNAGNVGISLLGYYHPPYDHELTEAQRRALAALGSWLREAYGVEPQTYRGHRDYNARTDCPGDKVYPQLGAIRDSFRTAASGLAQAARRLRRFLGL